MDKVAKGRRMNEIAPSVRERLKCAMLCQEDDACKMYNSKKTNDNEFQCEFYNSGAVTSLAGDGRTQDSTITHLSRTYLTNNSVHICVSVCMRAPKKAHVRLLRYQMT